MKIYMSDGSYIEPSETSEEEKERVPGIESVLDDKFQLYLDPLMNDELNLI